VRHLTGGFLSRIASHLSTLVLLVVGARHVGPAEFGAYALGSIAVTLIGVVIYSGAYEYLLKSDDPDRDGGTAFAVMVGVGVGSALGLLLAADLLATAYRSGELALVLRLFAVVPLFACLSAWREANYLRDPSRLERYFGLVALRDVVSLLAGLALLRAGWGLHALIAYRVLLAVIEYLLFRWVSPRLPVWRTSLAQIRHVLAFGGGLTGSRLLGFVGNNGIDLLIGLILTPAAVGLYRIADRLVVAVYDVVAQPLVKSVWVRLAAHTRLGQDGLEVLGAFQTLAFVVLGSALSFVALAAPALVPTLLGPQWEAAVALVPFVAGALLFNAAGLFVEPLLSLRSATARLFLLRLAATSVALAGVAAGAAWGGIGVAVQARMAAAVVSATLMWAGALYWTRIAPSTIGRSLWVGGLAVGLSSALVSAVPLLALPRWPSLVLQAVAAIAAIAVMLLLFRSRLAPALRRAPHQPA